MRIALFFVIVVVHFGTASAADNDDLREQLASLARVAGEPAQAAADLARYRAAWTTIAELAEPDRGKWERTLAAVMARVGNVYRVLRADATAERSVSGVAAELLARAETYYRAMREACEQDCPASLVRHVDRALAVAIRRRAMEMRPDERGALMDDSIRREFALAAASREADESLWEALALANLSYQLFAVGRNDETFSLRDDAIERFESLPEDSLDLFDLGLDEPYAGEVVIWSRLGYQDQATTYLLRALDRYNDGLDDLAARRESVYLYAESLRIGWRHDDEVAVNNVASLLILSGVGDETGRGRRIRYLLDVLDLLSDPDGNSHWRGRGALSGIDETLAWLRARIGGYLADFYMETGQLLQARYQLDVAHGFVSELRDERVLPMILEAKARLLARVELHEEALRIARQALDLRDTGLAQRSRLVLLMAEIARSQGDHERAADYLRWAWDLFLKPGSFTIDREDLPAMVVIREVEAHTALARGRRQEALTALNEAASLAALEDGDRAIELRAFGLRLAETEQAAGRFEPSAALLTAIDSAAPRHFASLAAGRGAGVRVRVRETREETTSPLAPGSNEVLTEAQASLLRPIFSLAEASATPEPQSLRELLDVNPPEDDDLAARAALALGDLDEAAQHYSDRLTIEWRNAAENLDPALGIESPKALHRMHHEAALVQTRLGRPAEALAILDMARHRGLLAIATAGPNVWDRLTQDEQATASRLDDVRTQATRRVAELAKAANGGGRLGQPLAVAQRELIAAESQWLAYKTQIRTAYRVPAPSREPLSAEAIAALVDDGEALLVYSVGTLETIAVLVRRDEQGPRFVARELPILEGELAALVDALRLGVVRPDGSYRLLARELYDVMLAPFADELTDVRLLAVAPDGPLNNLPFAVLEDQQGAPLLTRRALCRVGSLEQVRRLRDTPSSPDRAGLLVVDLADFHNREWIPSAYAGELSAEVLREILPRYHLDRLEGTEREATRITELFEESVIRLTGNAAAEAEVFAAAATRRHLHFATHGLVDAYNPFQSVLVLAAPTAGSAEDGFLEAAEILESPALAGADLVTLSACDSGLGLLHGSEGVLGLTWAFLAAGNRTVLASLWSVDDAATADLMVSFYAALRDGEDKVQALRTASLHLRSDPRTADPAYWAPFQLTGDWRER